MMAKKNLSRAGKQAIALNLKINTRTLKKGLREIIDIIAKLEQLQHHRKFCVDGVSRLTVSEQQALTKNGFDFLTFASFVEESDCLYKEICSKHIELARIHKKIVRSEKLINTRIPANLEETFT